MEIIRTERPVVHPHSGAGNPRLVCQLQPHQAAQEKSLEEVQERAEDGPRLSPLVV